MYNNVLHNRLFQFNAAENIKILSSSLFGRCEEIKFMFSSTAMKYTVKTQTDKLHPSATTSK